MKRDTRKKPSNLKTVIRQRIVYISNFAAIVTVALVLFHDGSSLNHNELAVISHLQSSSDKAVLLMTSLDKPLTTQPNESTWLDSVTEAYGDKDELPTMVAASYDQPITEVEDQIEDIF